MRADVMSANYYTADAPAKTSRDFKPNAARRNFSRELRPQPESRGRTHECAYVIRIAETSLTVTHDFRELFKATTFICFDLLLH